MDDIRLHYRHNHHRGDFRMNDLFEAIRIATRMGLGVAFAHDTYGLRVSVIKIIGEQHIVAVRVLPVSNDTHPICKAIQDAAREVDSEMREKVMH